MWRDERRLKGGAEMALDSDTLYGARPDRDQGFKKKANIKDIDFFLGPGRLHNSLHPQLSTQNICANYVFSGICSLL